jgi:hypothetical protein
MQKIKHDLTRALTLPPHILIQKTASKGAFFQLILAFLSFLMTKRSSAKLILVVNRNTAKLRSGTPIARFEYNELR